MTGADLPPECPFPERSAQGLIWAERRRVEGQLAICEREMAEIDQEVVRLRQQMAGLGVERDAFTAALEKLGPA